MIRMSGLEPEIAKTAAAASGDAVILQAEDDDLIGASSFGVACGTGGRGWAGAFGSSIAMPIKAHESRYIVVKYLADEPGSTSAAQILAPDVQPNAAPSAATTGVRSQPTAIANPSTATPPRAACGMVKAQPDGSQKIVRC